MISIIIPTYNDEKYIGNCLDSVIRQTYEDYEVIVVIDGATDNTKKIVQTYENKIKRLLIIEQDNAGPGVARNNGIEHASGEFIMFVDSDDWLPNNALETFWKNENAMGADWILAGSNIYETIKGKLLLTNREKYKNGFLTERDEIKNECFFMFLNGCSHGPCGKLYKSDIIQRNNLRFPSIRRLEDTIFNNEYMRHLNSIQILEECLYNIRLATANLKQMHSEKNSRRNEQIYIEAEKKVFDGIKEAHRSIRETFSFWGSELSAEKQAQLNGKIIIDIHNAIVSILSRDKKTAHILLQDIIADEMVKQALTSDMKFISKYYARFAHYLHKKNIKAGIRSIAFRNFVYPLLKKPIRWYKRRKQRRMLYV